MIGLARWAIRSVMLLLRLTGAGVAAFHVWLFASLAADGRLGDPVVAVRWLMAVGVVVGLVALKRAGIPMLASRRGAALWLLVVLLHAGAIGGSAAGPGQQGAGGRALLFVL